MSSRKQRRQGGQEPSTHRADIRLRMPGHEQAWVEHADDAFTLWAKTTFGTLDWLAPRPDLKAGFLLDFINRQPEGTRRLLASGIISGQGLQVVEKPSDKDGTKVLECTFPVRYPPLAEAGQAERQKKGIWAPGDPLPS